MKINKLSVHERTTPGATEAGWFDIPITTQRVDLLTPQNGVLATLGQTPLASGKYTQMRLLLADSAIAAPGQLLPNSVVPTGGTETALTTPSGRQTGVKLRIDIDVRIDVAADKLADFVIDFQVCKSLVAAGGADSVGRYLAKPVLGVTPHCVSGVKAASMRRPRAVPTRW